ncbi:acetyltransferase [Hydrogenophaga crassostreae]|uniref:Acetyltransferase n=1 Tax=Hydrogenophaga crassostreae TaxID=1763535 RepID=A0A167HW65_9BURK|nr:N-acetyltransferase [Hydrogenophaga crassostreae]AOW13523.1 GNAT family N-acetyltransferase [Hydrogenophaga crassostreae]OAD41813.1 acetyltransferase [Hydrogenophaga crassostreae]
MDLRTLDRDSKEEVAHLFTSVFSSSEGVQEGRLIGSLASALAARADNQEIICVGAFEDGSIIGAIFFTRLKFDEHVEAYMLAPVAVSTAHQGKGFGQAMIGFGLQELKNRSAALVVTYGDPAFYSMVGFKALSEDVIRAPLPLSMPKGWLGQSLSGEALPALKSRPACVQAFDHPEYW